jgi:hypothetical protein
MTNFGLNPLRNFFRTRQPEVIVAGHVAIGQNPARK